MEKSKLKIIRINKNEKYLREYATLCYLKWSNRKTNLNSYVDYKVKKILSDDNVITILGLIQKDKLLGFISLFKKDGCENKNLTPWYATMYVKKEYRKLGYSVLLNDAILKEAKQLGYDKVYLKSDLVNYYEKFGAIFKEKLKNGESLYYINLNN